ncbi:MAG TPA: DUF3592 domain-containing protein [Candidatus Acidoferrales bacterium]|jgi:hypothetical protein|nr:DUF3592 domain-containing protein [Candidatus Acidoferrales bacterium]
MTTDNQFGVGTLFTLAAVLFALGFWIRRMERAARKWPQVSGIIVTSSTLTQSVRPGENQILPVIEYEFEHQGRPFKSSHWRFGNYSTGSMDSVQEITSRYPVGAAVTVFVNPRQPAKSVLEAHTSGLSWVPFGFGFFFLFMGLLALVAILHQR